MSVEKVIIRTSYKTTQEQEICLRQAVREIENLGTWSRREIIQSFKDGLAVWGTHFHYRMVEKVIA